MAATETTREKVRRLRAPCPCCGRSRTMAEVARELGVSRQRVHQLIAEEEQEAGS